jgi:16S rRNA (adenine1518-N6/adenine1519-N6)-dimethyltransferase
MSSPIDLFSPAGIQRVLEERSLSLTRRFGQNFLINRQLAERILGYLQPRCDESVLEVGPGLGTLTYTLAARAGELTAVEIDAGFARFLREECEARGLRNVHVLNGDFLRLDPGRVQRFAVPCKAVSNFPYAVAIKAIIKILEEYGSVNLIVGAVQEEIARRITASPGEKNYSAVSVYVQYLSRTAILHPRIAPGSFFPAPDVSSAIVRIERITEAPPVDRAAFRAFVRACFSSRRKSLVNNLLAAYAGADRRALERIMQNVRRDPLVRAEGLAVKELVELAADLLPLLRKWG